MLHALYALYLMRNTAVDFDGLVRLTNEFKFPIAAFHHAHSSYLVPDLLKKTYGGAPALALFATNARYVFFPSSVWITG